MMLRVSAKLDYAIRALTELARDAPRPIKGDELARRQAIPFRFLEVTLGELRQSGLVRSRRGSDGGYWLERDPTTITLAEVSIAVEGALVDLRAVPQDGHDSTADLVRAVWDETHRRIAGVLTQITLADVAAGRLPGIDGMGETGDSLRYPDEAPSGRRVGADDGDGAAPESVGT
jgi:Rrf2 family protein